VSIRFAWVARFATQARFLTLRSSHATAALGRILGGTDYFRNWLFIEFIDWRRPKAGKSTRSESGSPDN
jgi:hypothetical protein